MSNSSGIENLIRAALDEDFSHGGDITSDATIPEDLVGTAIMRAREDGVISGIDVALKVFETVDPSLETDIKVKNSDFVAKNTAILSVTGSMRSILKAERVALNFISHLSGVASLTARYAKEIKATKSQITDTRKTVPGLRALQKQAVLDGGGVNHRMSLGDQVLIKDNHIAMAGGVSAALDAVVGSKVQVEIEVDTLEQLQEVLEHGGADIVLLDNMDVETLKKAGEMVNGKMITEASGGVNLETVRAIAETGVDRISVGALTHSAPALDIGLDIETN